MYKLSFTFSVFLNHLEGRSPRTYEEAKALHKILLDIELSYKQK